MKLTELKGIGEKTAALFHKLSINDPEDLLKFYPRDYDIYEAPVLIKDIAEHADITQVAVEGVVAQNVDIRRTGSLQIITTSVKDKNGDSLKCTWFNMPFLRTTLRQGYHCVFRGRITLKDGGFVMEQPVIYKMADYSRLLNSMQPIYPLTKGLTNNAVTKAVRQVLDFYKGKLEKEFLPDHIREQYNLAAYQFAINNIHFPKEFDEFYDARKRLAFEEFFLFILSIRQLKESNVSEPNGYVINNDNKTDIFIEKLPYTLTNAQKKAWDEVKENMSGHNLMSRLIQGDVGSGKTIVATLALMNTAFAGYQGAMMVPTEVLAKQQFESVTELFEQYHIPLKVGLLIGSMTASEKKREYARIQSGEVSLIIGTHALIQEKAVYNNLALVITDEQHRFGVRQREALAGKGDKPHVLVMSATPIPRTLAIIVYGDLDISIIDELPSNRVPIKNCVVDIGYRNKAYRFIEEQIGQGRQAYVICPMVEESENVEAENVIDYASSLRETFASNIRVEYLHGKMKASEKNSIMEQFSQGDVDVLVSTTVIEVGVNVPNAAVMLIENADRFGLAQLHQLRGRVGRGSYQSYCIFMSGNASKKNRQRLEILNQSNDGFKIAEEDLKLRGPGDFFGIRQSGEMEFKVGDIFSDAGILKNASEAAASLLEEDPQMSREEHFELSGKVSEYMEKCLNKINL